MDLHDYGDATVAAVTISNKCYMLVRNVVLGICSILFLDGKKTYKQCIISA